jgi:hypothetical protein
MIMAVLFWLVLFVQWEKVSEIPSRDFVGSQKALAAKQKTHSVASGLEFLALLL